jgi:hypothetical protein
MKYDAVAFLEALFRPPPNSVACLTGPAPAVGEGPEVRVEDLDPDWRIEWEKRAAIREYDGGLPRERAEAEALAEIVAKMRRSTDLSRR